jgi:hypothetical protein
MRTACRPLVDPGMHNGGRAPCAPRLQGKRSRGFTLPRSRNRKKPYRRGRNGRGGLADGSGTMRRSLIAAASAAGMAALVIIAAPSASEARWGWGGGWHGGGWGGGWRGGGGWGWRRGWGWGGAAFGAGLGLALTTPYYGYDDPYYGYGYPYPYPPYYGGYYSPYYGPRYYARRYYYYR